VDNQAEFKSYLERLGIEQPALCILLGVQRSTLNKWVNGTVTAIPAIATTAVKMLWFIKESDPQLFQRWMMIQDFGVPAEYATNDKAYEFLHVLKREPSPPIKKLRAQVAAQKR
jgi:transcriptional regulator with XRE-family HTH domain